MKIRKSDITALQEFLASEGYYPHTIDGLSGPNTLDWM